MAAPAREAAKGGSSRRPLAAFVGIGPRLTRYDVDVEAATLIERDSLLLAENVQYAWPHASGDFLYVALSNGGPGGTGNNRHYVAVVGIDPVSGRMSLLGAPRPLASRPVHITTDARSEHALLAHNEPSGITVLRIERDATLGAAVPQAANLDFGIYAHQLRVSPDDRSVIVVSRGHDPRNGRGEEPGALNVFDYRHGVLMARAVVAPGGGYGFGPRILDFDPAFGWILVALERQNQLAVFAQNDGAVDPKPLFVRETLVQPHDVRPRQLAGAIHLHPDGRTAYVANRALGFTDFEGRRISAGGETAIAVFALDPITGPLKRQDIDTRGGSPRTFALDPTGHMLIAGNSSPLATRHGNAIETVPINLALFHVEPDGTLRFARRYELPDTGSEMLWMGLVA